MKIEMKTNQAWMGKMSSILDSIIAVQERSSQCGLENSPTGEDIQKIIADNSIGNEEIYVFPIDDNPTKYNSFLPTTPEVDQDRADGASADTPKTITEGSTAYVKKISQSKPDDCLKKIPAMQVEGVKEWMDIIRAKSQERT
jgi:hypothetical protein